MVRFFNPDNAPRPASNYSQVAEIRANHRRLVISGQVGQAPDGTIGEGYEAQALQAWENILAALGAAGMDASDIVKVTVFDVAPGNVAAYRAIRDRVLAGHAPACTYVIVSGLANPAFLTEIEAEAAREE